MKMRFYDFKRLLLSVLPIGLMAVCILFLDSCARDNPTVHRDEENENQNYFTSGQSGGTPFCDDSSKCIVFKPRTGEYSYEKAPLVLQLPKNLGKYAFMTGLVTTGEVRSIKIFVDEAIFDKGSEKIEKFLSIFSVSGTKKESSLLSLSAINDSPIPMTRLDFSLDENDEDDEDFTYVHVKDTPDERYIEDKIKAYKAALKGELDSGAHEEEEAKKLEEGLAWLEKDYETIRDEVAKNLAKKKYLDALTDKIAVLQNGVNSVESVNPIFDKETIEFYKETIEFSDTYKKTKGFITDIEILLANGVVDYSAKLGEVDRFITSMSNEGDADGSKIDGTIRDELKQCLSDKMTAQVTRMEGWKDAIDKEALSVEELATSFTHGEIKDFVSSFGNKLPNLETKVLTKSNSVSDYVDRFELYTRFIAWREVDGIDSESTFVSKVYEEMLDDRLSIFRDYENAGTDVVRDKYGILQFLPLSPTYVALAEMSLEWIQLREGKNYEEGYNRSSVEMKDLEDAGIHTTEEFAIKVIEEIVKELTDRLAILKSGVNSVESENPSIAKDIIELSDTYTKTKGFITDIETDIETDIANGVGGHKANLEAIDRFISSMSNEGAADGSKIDGTIRDEIKQGLSDKMTAQVARVEGWKDAIDKEALSVEELATSDTYGDVDEFITTVKGSVVLTKRDSVNDYVARFGKYTTFIADLEANDVDSAPTFVSKVYEEMLDDRLSIFRDYENAGTDVVRDKYGIMRIPEFLPLSPTYVALDHFFDDMRGFMLRNQHEEGYNRSLVEMKDLEDAGIHTTEEFATKVIEEIEAAKDIVVKELTDRLSILKNGVDPVENDNPSIAKETIELSDTYKKTKGFITDIEILLANGVVDNSAKLGEVDRFITSMSNVGAADGSKIDGTIRDEIKQGLSDEMTAQVARVEGWLDAIDKEALSVEELDTSDTYVDVDEFITTVKGSVVLTKRDSVSDYVDRFGKYTTFIADLEANDVDSAPTFVLKVYEEMLDDRLSIFRDYENAGTDVVRDKYGIMRIPEFLPLSPTYVALAEMRLEWIQLREGKNYEEGYNRSSVEMKDLEDAGIHTTEEFATKVIEEIEAAKDIVVKELTDRLAILKSGVNSVESENPIVFVYVTESNGMVFSMIGKDIIELSDTYTKTIGFITDIETDIEILLANGVVDNSAKLGEVDRFITSMSNVGAADGSKIDGTIRDEIKQCLSDEMTAQFAIVKGWKDAIDKEALSVEELATSNISLDVAKFVDVYGNNLPNPDTPVLTKRDSVNDYLDRFGLYTTFIGWWDENDVDSESTFVSKVYEEMLDARLSIFRDYENAGTDVVRDKYGIMRIPEFLPLSPTYVALAEMRLEWIQLREGKNYEEGYNRSSVEMKDLEDAGIHTTEEFETKVIEEIVKELTDRLAILKSGVNSVESENPSIAKDIIELSDTYTKTIGFITDIETDIEIDIETDIANNVVDNSVKLGEVDRFITSMSNVGAADGSKIDGTIRDEIKQGLSDKMTAQVARVEGWKDAIDKEALSVEELDTSDTYGDVDEFITTVKGSVVLTKRDSVNDYVARFGKYTTFIADLEANDVDSAPTFVSKVYQEILADLLTNTKSDYIDNTEIAKAYPDKKERLLSTTYSEINTAVTEAEASGGLDENETGYTTLSRARKTLETNGVSNPTDFSTTVIREIGDEKAIGVLQTEIVGLETDINTALGELIAWKDAVEGEAINAKDLDLSNSHTEVTDLIASEGIPLAENSPKSEYVTRKTNLDTLKTNLKTKGATDSGTYIELVYQEILVDLMANTRTDYIDNAAITVSYTEQERLLSTTYSGINTAVKEAMAFLVQAQSEAGYDKLAAGIKAIATGGITKIVGFETRVIREIEDGKKIKVEIDVLKTEITTALNKLRDWTNAVDSENIKKIDLALSSSHAKVKNVIAIEGVELPATSVKAVYETRKQNIEDLKAKLPSKTRDEHIELVYQEILDELLVSTRKDYIDNTGITGSYTEIEREFSVKYRGINTAFKAADASVVLKNHATGYANLLSGMDKLANGGIKNPADFVREVSLEIEDEKKIKREIDVLKTEIITALNKLKDWRDAVDAKNIQNLDLSQSHTDIVDVIADEEVELPATSVKSVYETRKQNLEDLKDELEVKTKDEYIELVYREVLSSLLEAVKTGYLNNPKVIATYKTRKKMLERSPLYKAIDMAVVEAEALESQGKYEEGYVRLSAGIGGLFAGGVDEFNLFLKNLKEMKGNRRIMKRYIKKLGREYINSAEIKLFAKSDRRISEAYNKLRKAFIAGKKESKAERFEEGYKELKAKVDAMQFADGSAFMAKVTEEIGDVIGVEVDEKIAILDAWLSLVEGKISKGQVLNTSKRYKEVKDFKKANPKPSAVIDYRASLVGYTRFINDKERAGITTADTFNREVYRELLKAILIDIKNNYMFNAIVENVYKTEGEKVISKSYRNLKEAVDVAKIEQAGKRYEVGYTALKAVVDAMKFTDATELLNIIQAEIGGVRTEINKKVDTLNTWLSFVAVKITKATTREFSDTYTKVRDFKRLNPKPILLRNYAVRLGNYITFMADMKKAGITTAATFNREVYKDLLGLLIIGIETNYIGATTITDEYKTEAARLFSKSYRKLKEAVDVAKAEQTANRYEVGYKVFKAVIDAMKFADASALLTKMKEEIGRVSAKIDKKIAILDAWLSLVEGKISKGQVLNTSKRYKEVKDFKKANLKPSSVADYRASLADYTTFIKKMKKTGITTADTFNRKVDQEIESALQDRVETFKRDYTENARIIGLYATEQGRELSSVYKAINTAVKEGESFIKQGLYVAADARLIAGMDDLVDDAINVPDKFEKKVIEEIEAAVLSGKVITKREGVVDYIVSSFYSFIDRLIESRDKIKNTDRETVKVFQGNVAGGNDLGLDLDVLKEEASWGNFSRFKGFVEAGGWAYLQDVKVDFSYTQKDAGLKLSCKNSSFFMTKEEFWLKAKSGDRGINLGDFKTPDMYNCDLSWVKKPEVEKRSKRSIKFRVKGVNIAAADESKLDNLGDLDTLIKNGFLFSEIAQKEILKFKKVKCMPVVDVEIIVLDTASFEEKCKEIGCNVDVDPEVVPPLVLGGEKVAILFKGEDNFTDFALRY